MDFSNPKVWQERITSTVGALFEYIETQDKRIAELDRIISTQDAQIEQYDEALNLSGTEEEASEVWQPIETAPKDGTEILVWNSRMDHPCIAVWYCPPDSVSPDWWVPENCPEKWTELYQPTHWMPLPEPPKGATDAKETA